MIQYHVTDYSERVYSQLCLQQHKCAALSRERKLQQLRLCFRRCVNRGATLMHDLLLIRIILNLESTHVESSNKNVR